MNLARLTPDQRRDAKRARAVRYLRSFVKGAWAILEPGRPLVWSWHMDVICEALESVTDGDVTELVINIPPRHSKSTLVAVCWPAWMWLADPTKRFYNLSGIDKVAKRDSRAMRKICNSEWYKDLQEYMRLSNDDRYVRWTWAGDQNEKINFENSLGGYRKCTTMRGGILGDGADIIIIDDPYDAKDVMGSVDQVTRRMEWMIDVYDNVLESRLNDPKTGARVTIMQRLHERDIPGYLLKKYINDGVNSRQGFDYIVLPTQYDPDHPYVCCNDPRTERGELLNPDRYDADWVEERANDPKRAQAWASQHGQLPRPAQGTKFLSHQFENRYTEAPWVIVHQMDQVIISVDAAEKEGPKNDDTAMHVWGKKGSKLYLLARDTRKMEITELIRSFRALCVAWPMALIRLIEDKSNGTALIQICKTTFGMSGIVAINPKGSKPTRAKYSQVAYEAGDIVLPSVQHAPWIQDFIDQHLGFPTAPHDDDIDAESQAVLHLAESKDQTELVSALLNAFG